MYGNRINKKPPQISLRRRISQSNCLVFPGGKGAHGAKLFSKCSHSNHNFFTIRLAKSGILILVKELQTFYSSLSLNEKSAAGFVPLLIFLYARKKFPAGNPPGIGAIELD